MQAVMPYVDHLLADIDSPGHIMSRDGNVIGFTPNLKLFVWQFGYIPDSPHADAHKVSTKDKGFLWVLSDIHGKAPGSRMSDPDDVRHAWPTFWGFACELPEEFRKVINSKKGR